MVWSGVWKWVLLEFRFAVSLDDHTDADLELGFLVRSVVGRMNWSLDIGITGVWVCLDDHNEVVLELCFLGEVCRGGGWSGLWNVWYMIGNIFGYGFKFYI